MCKSILSAGVALALAFCGLGSASAAPPATEPADLVHFRRVSIPDEQMKSTEAFSLLAPVDWKTTGGVYWNTRDIASPAVLKVRVTSPAGDQQVGFYPTLSFYWSRNAMVQRSYPRGSRFMGALVEPTVTDCKAALARAWVMTQGKIAGAKILDFKDLPDYAKAYEASLPQGTGVQYTLKGGRLRVEYPDPKTGALMDAEMIGVLLVVPNPAAASTNWMIDDLISYRAPAGQLDADEKKMEVVSSSLRPNLQWYAGYMQAQQALVNMQAQNSAAALQRAQIEFQAQQKISAMQQEAFQKRENAMEKSNEAWDRIIRGVTLYQNPDGSKVELPSDYNHAWTNGNGDYAMSNSGFYNPNGDLPGSWQPLTPAPNN